MENRDTRLAQYRKNRKKMQQLEQDRIAIVRREKKKKVKEAAKELAQRKKEKKQAEETAIWLASYEGKIYSAMEQKKKQFATPCISCGEVAVGIRCKDCENEIRNGTLPSISPNQRQVNSAACRVVRSTQSLS